MLVLDYSHQAMTHALIYPITLRQCRAGICCREQFVHVTPLGVAVRETITNHVQREAIRMVSLGPWVALVDARVLARIVVLILVGFLAWRERQHFRPELVLDSARMLQGLPVAHVRAFREDVC